MSSPQFVHLHVHTHYSLLDGATRIGALVDRAKEFGMPAVAISDHGNLFGAIEFYSACKNAGIKPIIGCEMYLARGHHKSRDAQDGKEQFHLLLLAQNLAGYRNLLKLSSLGFTEGFYRKPRIDKEQLCEFSDGLICTSTCIGGEVPQALLHRDRKFANQAAETYLDIFGADRFFVELQDHNMEEQQTLNPELVDMANKFGVGLIATNDVHYLEHDDVEAHDVLCCINTGRKVADEDRFKFPSDQFYFKDAEEMAKLFPDHPEALSNTLRIADMCDLELDLSSRHAPVYRVPDEVVSTDTGAKLTDAEYLRKLVYDGAAERYDEITDELRERIDYELGVITSKGFASYFLIVWDCVNYAREHGIPVGARGSGCSSVVGYCLYISTPDPMRYGLYFERFMDPDRDEMPDIDLDICQNGRQQLIEYVRDKYGHVAQIITFGTLKARAAVKDVSRVLGVGFDEANKLSQLIPMELKMTLDKALEREPELLKRYNEDDEVKRVIDIARKVEGLARNSGVHAAGVVVADKPLDEFLPLAKATGGDAIVTQFDGPTVERVGLLKMDFLGLRTLTILEHARKLASQRVGKEIDLAGLDLTDSRVYELFGRGDTKGVFQFESGGMRDVIMRMRPNRIEDLIAANALYRPGPMEYIPDYIERKHGKSWTTPHTIMTEVLEETYGIMVYQEQVSRMVNRLGGIELKAAFRLAKAISKKKTEMIEKMREPFLDGCEKNGVARKTANEVFEDILKFGGYAFNKAHSTGYALVAFQTAWMKAYFPVEFMTALMTFEMGSTEKVAEYREACKEMGISVDPPDINVSSYDFGVGEVFDPDVAAAKMAQSGRAEVGSIRFGLGAIKGVGQKAVEAIASEREENGEFEDIYDFCERVDLSCVPRGAIEAMICAGAFDGTGAMRKGLMDVVEGAIKAGQTAQADKRSGQMGLFGGGDTPPAPAKSSRTISDAEWTESEMLAREKAVLGFYVTKHPLASHQALLDACATATTVDLAKYEQGDEVVVGGIISRVRPLVGRSGRNEGKQFGVLHLEDLAGKVEALLLPDQFSKYRADLEPDTIVFVVGTVDRKREEPSIRVERIVLEHEAATALTRAVILNVESATRIEDVRRVLVEHRGDCRVYLNVRTGSDMMVQLETAPTLRIDPSGAAIDRLAELLGPQSVCLLGSRNKPIPASERRRIAAPPAAAAVAV